MNGQVVDDEKKKSKKYIHLSMESSLNRIYEKIIPTSFDLNKYRKGIDTVKTFNIYKNTLTRKYLRNIFVFIFFFIKLCFLYIFIFFFFRITVV